MYQQYRELKSTKSPCSAQACPPARVSRQADRDTGLPPQQSLMVKIVRHHGVGDEPTAASTGSKGTSSVAGPLVSAAFGGHAERRRAWSVLPVGQFLGRFRSQRIGPAHPGRFCP